MNEVIKEMEDKGKNSISIKKFLDLSGKNRNLNILKVRINNIPLSKKEEELVLGYYDLIVNTDYFSLSTYKYLVDNKGYKQIAKELGKKSVTYLGNVTSKESKELFNWLGIDPYYDIIKNLDSKNRMDDKDVSNKLLLLNDVKNGCTRKEKFNQEDLFTVDIEKDYGYLPVKNGSKLDNKVLVDYMKALRFLSRNYLDFMLKNLDKEYLEYILYLIDTPKEDLNKGDENNQQLIRRLWMLDEF